MKLHNDSIYPRTALARYFVDFLRSSDSSSGVFMAAPRRTGKTTFIKEDLIPLLEQEGGLVIYVDLWEDKTIDPATVVAEGIRKAILALDGPVLKGARSTGLTRFKIAGFELDLTAIGTAQGETISSALQLLSKAAKKPIFLVIDEAQHAQTTDAGRAMLFGLKAARDALLLDKDLHGFRLLATGSNSEKLTALVSSKDQAFYKAPLEAFAPLGEDYLAWLLATAGSRPMPTLPALTKGFERVGHRPEPLKKVLRTLLKEHESDRAQLVVDTRFLWLIEETLDLDRTLFLQNLNGLDPLDAAVLRRMAKMGNNFAAFDEAAMASYRESLGKHAPDNDTPITKSSVQTSLERLRKEGYIWNFGRGAWLIEDGQYATWINSDP